MKFSVVSTILLAQGIVAMPWSNDKVKTGEEITLHIQVSQGSSANQDVTTIPKPNGHIDFIDNEVCLKVCWPEEPKCPEGWSSKKLGEDNYPCWTCCKSFSDDKYL
ncbi:uncharacterized protein B0J16DRAFT_415374 [Fusarium flagelliforme]|uniref:Putative pathogenicity protein n=1 Tax=Fusarium flagelliforme TaxID=2675880 RepID=A0A395MJ32_9HYPO|nr:uncharacterized protein B0J16DRAFT_415374 [Fusarium flagelliforme]KAH7186107.1 hypothetical protein B0J16DRAFT_415374 [Fusarium flagelliforme]RFN47303.1 putative pathogenicity protein [Fusarium flagelliforme]